MSTPSQHMVYPLGRGLNTHDDRRALGDGELAVARDCQFVPGGLETRYPYASIGTTVLGGGSIANLRKIVSYGDELVLFTKDSIYSWASGLSRWPLRSTYLAPKVTERAVFVRSSDQSATDRATVSGVTVYVWTDAGAATAAYIGAVDAATGAVILSPTSIGSGSDLPKLVPLSGGKILLFARTASNTLAVKSLDPLALEGSLATTFAPIATDYNSYADCVALSSTTAVVVYRRTTTTAYGYATINDVAGITAFGTKARTCDGAISVSVTAAGGHIAVIRGSTTNIQGDVMDSAWADVDVGNAVGTASVSPDHIASAFRSVADSGQFRCYAFWNSGAEVATEATFTVKYNYMESPSGAVGTQGNFVRRNGVASRAFDHEGRVFVWTVFAGASATTSMVGSGISVSSAQIQNTYFLYRDDGLLIAKAAGTRSGGFETGGHLPHVQSLGSNVYAFCGTDRRIFTQGNAHEGNSDRGPLDISVEFDSDEARRCIQLGRTLYITGGQILQYDGLGIMEVGWHVYPWFHRIEDLAAGSIANGTYAYKCTVRHENAKGEMDRSTSAVVAVVEFVGGSSGAVMEAAPINNTLRQTPRDQAAWEAWRTVVSPIDSSPYYLVTNTNPTASMPNGFLFNDATDDLFTVDLDDFIDTTLVTKQTHPDTPGILEGVAPPPATVIAASEDRIFLAGISHDPYLIQYSKARGDGQVAQFNESLSYRLPMSSGEIVALAVYGETLFAFAERSIYALPGQGFDNTGNGQNFGPARVISTDMGAESQEACAVTPQGILFKSAKGWHILPGGGAPEYIGGQVKEFDSDTVLSMDVVDADRHVRILTDERMLVLDYSVSPPQWAEWTITDGVSSCVWNGTHLYANATTVRQQGTTYTGLTYGMDLETAWIKLDSALGQKIVRRIIPFGEHRSAFDLRLRYAVDFNESDSGGVTWVDDETWTSTPATVGGPLELKFGPSRQRCKAFKIRLTAQAVGSATPPAGEALKLTAIGLEIGVESKLHRNIPVAQKV